MTITVSPARNEYTSNAGQTVFNYTFKIFDTTDLNVYVTPAGQECSDSDLTTAYNVDISTIGDPAGGFITFNTPLNEGDLVTIVSAVPSSRTTDYQNNGDFRPDTVNNDFDRVVSIVKKLEDRSLRSPAFPECYQGGGGTNIQPPKIGNSIIFDGEKFVNYKPSSSVPSIPQDEVLGNFTNYDFVNISDVKIGLTSGGFLVDLKLGNRISTQGFISSGDGGGSDYIVVPSGSGSDAGLYHDLDNGLQIKLIIKGWMTPIQFGATGDGAEDDTEVIISFLKNVRLQLWGAGKKYLLDAATVGGSAFRVSSNTLMNGYGTTIILKSFGNNGFVLPDDEGTLFNIHIHGFRFENPTGESATVAILLKGFLNHGSVKDCVCVGMGQYFLAIGGNNSGFNNLSVVDNEVLDHSIGVLNEFSLCYEFYPKLQSARLEFRGNTGIQVGRGGNFKIHNITDADIYDNVFARTTDFGDSQSQCVMLGGRVGETCSRVRFHHNVIDDANTLYGALFIGNGQSNSKVDNNQIVSGAIWIGNDATGIQIYDNEFPVIYSLGATSSLTDIAIKNNKIGGINFTSPPSGNIPDTLDNVVFKDNTIASQIRLSANNSNDVCVTGNYFNNVTSLSLINCDNVTFDKNKVVLSDSWSAGSQFANVTGGDFKAYKNTFILKGKSAQALWFNGNTGGKFVDNIVEDAITRVVLNNGTGSEVFHNQARIGGSWSIV